MERSSREEFKNVIRFTFARKYIFIHKRNKSCAKTSRYSVPKASSWTTSLMIWRSTTERMRFNSDSYPIEKQENQCIPTKLNFSVRQKTFLSSFSLVWILKFCRLYCTTAEISLTYSVL